MLVEPLAEGELGEVSRLSNFVLLVQPRVHLFFLFLLLAFFFTSLLFVRNNPDHQKKGEWVE